MKLHHRVLAVLLVAPALGVSVSLGQTTPLPPGIKTSTAPSVAAITEFITGEVASLANSSDPQAQSDARDNLVAGASGQTSPIYQHVYCVALKDALKDRTTPQTPVRTRLLAAIVTCRVAERMGGAQFSDVILQFMKDSSEAVALWGVKAARQLVPAALRDPAANKAVLDALPAVIRQHPSGAIVKEAYEAVNLSDRGATPPMLQAAAKQMLDLLQPRVAQYVKGIPEEPNSEEIPVVFLSAGRLWAAGVLRDEQRTQTVQRLSDLISLLGQRAGQASPQELQRLVPLMKKLGSSLFVIGMHVQSADLQEAAKPLSDKVSMTTPAATITGWTEAIYPAIQNVPQFSKVQPPPTIQAAGPAPAPAPAPVTTDTAVK